VALAARLKPYPDKAPPLMLRLKNYADAYSDARVVGIDQEIFAVDVVDVDLVCVVPAIRPRLDETEPEAAILEARVSVDHYRLVDCESVFFAEIGAEAIVGNAAAASDAEPQRRD